VIKAEDAGDDGAVDHEQRVTERESDPDMDEMVESGSRPRPDPERLRRIVTDDFAFVWRSLLRLGVPRPDADDALQQVFLVASRKVDVIEEGRARAFLFATALRVASHARRTLQ